MINLRYRICCLVIAVFLLFGCSCNSKLTEIITPEYKYVIGVSQANLIEPWRIALYEEMKQQGDAHEDVRLVFADAAGDSARQENDVNHLIELGIDLLIISPNNSTDLREVIENVHQKIPVIVLDRDVEGNGYTLFIGSDNRLIGKLAGEYTAKLLGENGGTVLEITGAQGSPPVQALSQGFQEALEQNSQIEVVDVLDGDWLRDTAEMRMKDYLIKSEKVNVVFAHNDAMAYGAYIAAQELRVDGIKFIGVDGLDNEGKALVGRGVLVGTFFRHTGGKEAVDWALKILNGDELETTKIVLEPIPIIAS